MLQETTRLWSVDEYHRMIQTGILGPEERVELIEGQIVEMSPQLPPHATATGCASEYLKELLGIRVTIRLQVPVTLRPKSEPEPDIALVQPTHRRYRDHHPAPSEIFLIIEVADTTLKSDRQTKARMYAKANIADYWIIDVKNRCLFVLRSPGQETYLQETVLAPDGYVTPLAFPDISVSVEELLP